MPNNVEMRIKLIMKYKQMVFLKGKVRISKYLFIVFFQNKSDDYLYLKPGFLVHNFHLFLCWQAENTKWISCYRKMVLNVQNLRFLMYKLILCVFYLLPNQILV